MFGGKHLLLVHQRRRRNLFPQANSLASPGKVPVEVEEPTRQLEKTLVLVLHAHLCFTGGCLLIFLQISFHLRTCLAQRTRQKTATAAALLIRIEHVEEARVAHVLGAPLPRCDICRG